MARRKRLLIKTLAMGYLAAAARRDFLSAATRYDVHMIINESFDKIPKTPLAAVTPILLDAIESAVGMLTVKFIDMVS